MISRTVSVELPSGVVERVPCHQAFYLARLLRMCDTCRDDCPTWTEPRACACGGCGCKEGGE